MASPIFLLRHEQLPPNLQAATRHRELEMGEHLYGQGDPAWAIFVVERGRLQMHSYTTEGKPVPLYTIRPGECVSEAALYAEHYCSDVIAEVASKVAVFKKDAVLAAFHERPFLSDEFGVLMTRRFNLLRIRLELRNLQSASERILQYLQATASPGENTVKIDRPLKSIADDLGLTHESFYRTLTQMVKDGVISRSKGSLQLRNSRAG